MTVLNYSFAGAANAVWPTASEVTSGNLSAGNSGDYLLDGAGNLFTTINGNRITSPNSGAWSQTSRAIEVVISSLAGEIQLAVSSQNGLLFGTLNLGTGEWGLYEFSSNPNAVTIFGNVTIAIGKKFEARLQGANVSLLYDSVNLFTPFAHGLNIATSPLSLTLSNTGAKISALRLADQFFSTQPAPSNIGFSNVNDARITATVATDPDYQLYVLERRIGAGEWTVLAAQASNAFVQTGLAQATLFEYRAKAICADGDTNYSSVFLQSTDNPVIGSGVGFNMPSFNGGGTGSEPLSPIPTITGGPFSCLTGTTLAGVIAIQDFDNQSGHTFVIGGANASMFVIANGSTPMTRELRFASPANVGVFNITLRASDPNANQSNVLAVQVTVQEVAPGLPDSFRLRENLTQNFEVSSDLIACYVNDSRIAQIVNIDNPATSQREFRLVARNTGSAMLVVKTNVGETRKPIEVINALPSSLLGIVVEPESVQMTVGGTLELKALLKSVAGYDLEDMPATWSLSPSNTTVMSLAGGAQATLANANGLVKNTVTALAAGTANVIVSSGGRSTQIQINVL